MEMILTTTVKITSETSRLLPVKTDKPISEDKLKKAMKRISKLQLKAPIMAEEVAFSAELKTFKAISFTELQIPAIPIWLLFTAPIIPAQCVPWLSLSSSIGSVSPFPKS